MKLDHYAMPILEENFHAISHDKLFNVFCLCLRYHQIDIREGEEEKIIFYGVNDDEKEQLY